MSTDKQPDAQPVEKSQVDQVRDERLAMKAENDAMESELARREKLRAAATLAGKTSMTPPAPAPVETAKDYARKVMAGKLK